MPLAGKLTQNGGALPPSLPQGAFLTPEMFGAVGNGTVTAGSGTGGSMAGTDDTAAIVAMLNRADTLLQAGNSVTCLFGPKLYYVNGAPSTAKMGNAVLPLPSLGYTPTTLHGIGANVPFNVPTLSLIGVPGQTAIICPRTDTYSATAGPPSIMGGPTAETLVTAGFDAGKSLPLRVETVGLRFIAPDQPTISGLDKVMLTSSHVENCGWFTTTTMNFETSGAAPTNRPPSTAFALRNPLGPGMESRNSIYRSIINGWGAGMVIGNHVVAQDVVMNYVNAMCAFDDYVANHAATSNAPAILLYIWCTGTQYLLSGWSAASGLISLSTATNPRNVWGVMGNDPFTAPWTLTAAVLDANSMIAGDLRTYGWANLFSYGGNPPLISGKSALLDSRPLDQSAVVGTATLVAGSATVTTGPAANALTTSHIKAGTLTSGGTQGAIFAWCSANGTVQIKSTSSSDTSTVWYEVTNPGP